MTKFHSLLTLAVLVLVLVSVSVSVLCHASMLGGRTKINNVKSNKEIQEIGRYSVEEYNRLRRSTSGENDGDLRFSEVVEAEKQVVSGMKYYLKIEVVSKSGDPKVFEAVVVVKPWLKSKQLVKFAPSSPKIMRPVW